MRSLRAARGETPEHVQSATGIDKRTIREWESGEANDAWVGKLARLAAHYGVPLMELLDAPDSLVRPRRKRARRTQTSATA